MNITNLKEIFENCCYENNNEKIYYNKSQRKLLTSVTGSARILGKSCLSHLNNGTP